MGESCDTRRPVKLAGILLTGGTSRRMGRDKASVPVGGVPNAERIAKLLLEVVSFALEVGPGRSGLTSIAESPPGGGPLVAVAAGARALAQSDRFDASLVVACDLPLIDRAGLAMLAFWPGAGSVVPVVGGRTQPLCARWSRADLDAATMLVARGERTMSSLVSRPGVELLEAEGEKWPRGLAAEIFGDFDTPEDLRRMGVGP